MRLPPVEWPSTGWSSHQFERWTGLVAKAARLEKSTGNNDAFERVLAMLRNMASTGRFGGATAQADAHDLTAAGAAVFPSF